MFYPQKKTYRAAYAKSRFCENEKWDYNVPPIITFEKKQPSTAEDQPVKGKKHKRYDNENTLSADPSEHRPHDEKKSYNYPAKKWRHDKFDESVSPHMFFPSRSSNKGGQKKPDRQLYCVREKQNQGNEQKETIEYHKKSHKKDDHLVRPSSAKETAASTREDDDFKSFEDENSFMSSLNSLLSQKDKGKDEDTKGSSLEFHDNAVIARGPIIDLLHSIHVADPHVMFELMLQNEKGTQNILVWDNEASYEKFLNELCEKNNIAGDMELYFKINLLKRIKDMQPSNKEVDSLLNKLLDLNFRMMLREMQNFEDNIALFARPYGSMNV